MNVIHNQENNKTLWNTNMLLPQQWESKVWKGMQESTAAQLVLPVL